MKTRFYYITTLAFDNVFKTQVIGWLNLYRENDVEFNLIRLTIFRDSILKSKKDTDKSIRELFSGKLISKYILPSKYYVLQFINGFLILLYLKDSIFSKDKIIIQTRNADLSESLKIVKTILLKRVKIIYDCRAAGAEEYFYKQKIKNKKFKPDNIYYRILKNELSIIKLSDRVFTVSKNLKTYFISKTDQTNNNKFFLYPCNADSNVFYYSQIDREKIRSEFNINNRIVLVYSGGFSLPWHLSEKMLFFFKSLYTYDNNFFLMLLTNDLDEAMVLINDIGLVKSSFMLKSVRNPEVKSYLSASDFGLLFRDDILMNNVASPTKFAEYIICGLPVIISDGVGDFTDFVKNNNAGIYFPIDNEIDFKKTVSRIKSYLQNDNKEKLIDLGLTHFSKQSLLPSVLSQYKNFIF